ncbi:hypothetical protein D8674_010388 [Pyrus ussuriensis x Pyrus communis]|uniref:Uncharacterized protein n=1 Tax=Pyrus ussuriensis x Pyrus communis TaxID=2448454 RepID=A0A5N5FAX2_9ROSA|nr:hypothetical protein D8674_010388 [Pyrus ussuriensis x Pyrus communis]
MGNRGLGEGNKGHRESESSGYLMSEADQWKGVGRVRAVEWMLYPGEREHSRLESGKYGLLLAAIAWSLGVPPSNDSGQG